MKVKRWEKKSIGVYSDGNIGTDGTSLYFMQEDFVKYNPRTGKKKKLFSGDKLEEMVEELKLPVTASSVVSDSSEVQDICTQAVWKHSIAYDDSYAESLWTETTGDMICFVDVLSCIFMTKMREAKKTIWKRKTRIVRKKRLSIFR